MKTAKLAKSYRVDDGKHFKLKDFDPADTAHWKSVDEANDHLQKDIECMEDLQAKLYAQDSWSLLLIFQAMDAAGKDGTIKHVMSGVNPEGVQVYSFKQPSAKELQHDFLWRTTMNLPERGRIGIFNRSYYEEVLVIRKFFLHLSKKEQKKRFLARLDEPQKNWKFSADDIHERKYWDDYQNAYEEMIRGTASKHAPWYVIPADNKWFTHLAVSAAIVEALEDLKLSYPKVGAAQGKALAAARKLLEK